jgi:hypothetical protein
LPPWQAFSHSCAAAAKIAVVIGFLGGGNGGRFGVRTAAGNDQAKGQREVAGRADKVLHRGLCNRPVHWRKRRLPSALFPACVACSTGRDGTGGQGGVSALQGTIDMPEHGSQDSPSLRKRHIAAVMIGGIVEYYDFVVFTFFAIQIGKAYFPASSEFASLMLSLATFGIGFAMRPLGGHDPRRLCRPGRTPRSDDADARADGRVDVALAVIPPYAAIGIAAPILAVIARLVRASRSAARSRRRLRASSKARPARRRGLFVSFFGLFSTAWCPARCAGRAGAVADTEPRNARSGRLADRVPARRADAAARGVAAAQPARDAARSAAAAPRQGSWSILREHRRAILAFFVIMAVGNIGFYIYQYATTYAQNVLHMPPSVGFASTVSLNAVGIVATLLGGWLADTVGRKPVFLVSRIAVAVLAVPCFCGSSPTGRRPR